ncbi:MAG: hypothetical protein AB1634_14945 [Thermodesulfobacteriota bacterium]
MLRRAVTALGITVLALLALTRSGWADTSPVGSWAVQGNMTLTMTMSGVMPPMRMSQRVPENLLFSQDGSLSWSDGHLGTWSVVQGYVVGDLDEAGLAAQLRQALQQALVQYPGMTMGPMTGRRCFLLGRILEDGSLAGKIVMSFQSSFSYLGVTLPVGLKFSYPFRGERLAALAPVITTERPAPDEPTPIAIVRSSLPTVTPSTTSGSVSSGMWSVSAVALASDESHDPGDHHHDSP